MDPILPLPKDELASRVTEGHPIPQCEVSALESKESARTGFGPVKGGPAATAQSIHDKQQNFYQKAGDVARKPRGEVTRLDAAEVMKAETRVLGEPPGKGSSSAAVQSLAEKNARQREQ